MKVLMFGWEFPPNISGGLGTASYGLTKGMALQSDIGITLVIPRPSGAEDKSFLKIIGACHTPIVWRDCSWNTIYSRIGKCMDPQLYYDLRRHIYADFRSYYTDTLGCIEFSGKYPDNLLEEINNYSIVSGVIARTLNFDIIHSHDWLTYPAGIHAKYAMKKPLVIHVHATDFDRSRGNVNPEVYEIEKNGMDHADHIIAVSNLTRSTIIEKYHQHPSKVTTVHNAVEPMSEKVKAIKSQNGTRDKVITFLGRITMQKGPEYFVEAAHRVLKKKSNVRFIMAGNGDMMDHLIHLVAQRNMSDKFHFTGFMKGIEVYEMLKSSDVYVMPSVSEPFGISPLEAMQCGIPSIISRQSGCAEILEKVIKIDYWDIEAMSDAMYSIITYSSMAEYLKIEGKKEVDKITWEMAGKRVRSIYDNLV